MADATDLSGRRVLDAGVTEADVARVESGPDAGGGSAREHLDGQGAIELLLLVGHHELLATAIGTLRIQPDRRRGRQAGGRG